MRGKGKGANEMLGELLYLEYIPHPSLLKKHGSVMFSCGCYPKFYGVCLIIFFGFEKKKPARALCQSEYVLLDSELFAGIHRRLRVYSRSSSVHGALSLMITVRTKTDPVHFQARSFPGCYDYAGNGASPHD